MNAVSRRVGLALMTLAACRPAPLPERGIVEAWLLCEECIEGELDSVVALGDQAVPPLQRALKGPPGERRENMRRQAEGVYALLPDTSIIIRQTYLDRYEANYVSSYQARAAVALGRIGTPKARQVVLAALTSGTTYRRDVQRALGSAARAALSVAEGDSQQAPVDSFVRVDPVVKVTDSATGQGIKGVRVRFFADSGSGSVDSVRVTDDSGKATVKWQLGPDPDDSLNLLRVVAGGRAVRIRAMAHRDILRLVYLTQPRDTKVGQAIVPPVRLEVQDPWGTADTSVNQPLTITVIGTGFGRAHNLVSGRATLTGLTLPAAGTGLRILAETPVAAPAESDSFDIVP